MALGLRARRIIKFTALGFGCLVLAGGGFVLARYLASGAEFKGTLADLAPADVSLVAHIDNIPARQEELGNFLDNGPLEKSRAGLLMKLEQSSLWRENIAPALGGGLQNFRENTLADAIAQAEKGAKQAGLTLFKDIGEGEALLCADFPGGKAEFIALSRVSRKVRFYWQFINEASPFLPKRNAKFSVAGGVLKITPVSEDGQPAPDLYVALLSDVLVAGNSPRLINDCVERAGKNAPGLSANARYEATLKLVPEESRTHHVAGLWLDLDRLRGQMTPVNVQDREISPVDAGRTLPVAVVRLNPDLFLPINEVLENNLATEPFCAAYYGLDVSNTNQLVFEQFLLADAARKNDFKHLQKTWAARTAAPSQLDFLPPDTMLAVSYRQPLDVLRDEVLDDRARQSFVGDFIRSFRDQKAEEVVVALAPRSWAPDLTTPTSPKIPLPAFVVGFRIPGAKPELAGDMLQGFLDNMRGRETKPGEAPKTGPLTVRAEKIGVTPIYGFNDARDDKEGGDLSKLTKAIVVGVVGEWLLMTDSREMLAFAINSAGAGKGNAAKESAFSQLPGQLHATAYVNFEKLAGYVGEKQLLEELRRAKYNPNTIEGRDPGEVRREIAKAHGLDPARKESLTDKGVTDEYNSRASAWKQLCETKGPAFANSIRQDLAGITLFRDLSLAAVFHDDHLYAKGIIRLANR